MRLVITSKQKKHMPQLIPFYFINQLSFSFLSLLLLIVIFSKFILFKIRIYKILNKNNPNFFNFKYKNKNIKLNLKYYNIY